MNKQEQIEKMARKICKSSSVGCNFPTCAKCGIKDTCKARIYATRAINEGYGDTKQALREFAQLLKSNCKTVSELHSGIKSRMTCVIWYERIDELLAEVTGE